MYKAYLGIEGMGLQQRDLWILRSAEDRYLELRTTQFDNPELAEQFMRQIRRRMFADYSDIEFEALSHQVKAERELLDEELAEVLHGN